MASVHQINLSKGGVPKTPVKEAVVDINGIAGDYQANLKHHGGPDRALCLYSLEVIEKLRSEGHPISPGSTGENVTIDGLGWDNMVPGAKVTIGQTVAEITSYTSPCWKIVDSFADGDSSRIGQEEHPGWSRVYAKVIIGGTIRTGDEVGILEP
jgi:MOSC domain-containing protein YiiM